jgi:hypothetical protein
MFALHSPRYIQAFAATLLCPELFEDQDDQCPNRWVVDLARAAMHF